MNPSPSTNPLCEAQRIETRRQLFQRTAASVGAVGLASLLRPEALARLAQPDDSRGAHVAPRAKRVIYLFQSGAPSQVDLFDYKPGLNKLQGTELQLIQAGEENDLAAIQLDVLKSMEAMMNEAHSPHPNWSP